MEEQKNPYIIIQFVQELKVLIAKYDLHLYEVDRALATIEGEIEKKRKEKLAKGET